MPTEESEKERAECAVQKKNNQCERCELLKFAGSKKQSVQTL
jgi:hypothetical protein